MTFGIISGELFIVEKSVTEIYQRHPGDSKCSCKRFQAGPGPFRSAGGNWNLRIIKWEAKNEEMKLAKKKKKKWMLG